MAGFGGAHPTAVTSRAFASLSPSSPVAFARVSLRASDSLLPPIAHSFRLQHHQFALFFFSSQRLDSSSAKHVFLLDFRVRWESPLVGTTQRGRTRR